MIQIVSNCLNHDETSIVIKEGQKRRNKFLNIHVKILVSNPSYSGKLSSAPMLVGRSTTRGNYVLCSKIISVLFICKIFSEVSELQEKAKKEGILQNDAEEVTKIRSEDNFMVWYS